jgi:hypothetical protein
MAVERIMLVKTLTEPTVLAGMTSWCFPKISTGSFNVYKIDCSAAAEKPGV